MAKDDMTAASRRALLAGSMGIAAVAAVAGSAEAAPKKKQAAPMSAPSRMADGYVTTTDGVKSMDIDVKTVDGNVTLTGVLANDVAVQKAVAAAKSVKGVKNVDSSGLKSHN